MNTLPTSCRHSMCLSSEPLSSEADPSSMETAMESGHSACLTPVLSRRARFVVLSVGAACVMSAVGLFVSGPSGRPPMSARALLESREFVELAATNIWRTSNAPIAASASEVNRSGVRRFVGGSFRNISGNGITAAMVAVGGRDLGAAAAGGVDWDFVRDVVAESLRRLIANQTNARRLNKKLFSGKQVDVMLQIIRGMGDPRVQEIGLEVAQLVQADAPNGPHVVRRRLLEVFEPRALELRQLCSEFFPVGLRWIPANANRLMGELFKEDGDSARTSPNVSFISPGGALQRQLSESNAEVLGTFTQNTSGIIDGNGVIIGGSIDVSTPPPESTDLVMKILGIIGGVMEEVRVVLAQTNMLSEGFKEEQLIPEEAVDIVSGFAFTTELTSCIMQASQNIVLALMCPMRFGSAFFEFIHLMSSMLPSLWNMMNLVPAILM